MNNYYITAPITVYQTCPKYFGQNTSHAEVVKRNFQKKKYSLKGMKEVMNRVDL